MHCRAIIALLFLAVGLPSLILAQEPPEPSPEAVRFFETKVRPVLAEHCFKCHGKEKQESGFRLDSAAGALGGGDRGQVIVPGQPDESLLVKAIGYQDPDLKMPPIGKLPDELIADLTRWVKLGAPWPGAEGDSVTPVRPAGEYQIRDQDRAHWSFQPVQRPETPRVTAAAWVANPIDAFILAGLEARGLSPNPPASRRELIRRASFDLTGLPPTPQEVEAFAADESPGAYAALIDRLLESPRYGEKWGRHWLDLVRFAETNSYERDNPKPNAWRYRDYVIRSFNDDKPYDQFVQEQLAGDELAAAAGGGAYGANAEALIATGFYRLGIWDDEPTDREQARYDALDDIVATTGQVFLGLTFDCARCHDHKIDPIPQRDYYRLLAFFQNIEHFRNGGPTDERPIFADAASQQAYETEVRELLAAGKQKEAESLPVERALCVSETGPQPAETFVLARGNPHIPSDKVAPCFPLVLGGAAPELPAPAPGAQSTGRRLELARWIASTKNPLAARVMANRVWQHHFGRGIVRSPNNFGLQGDKPTHPELLDWLASELVAGGWKLKPLHRTIMLSQAYRMSSRGDPAALAADPANDLFWRFDMRRLSAEEIRDSILAVNGSLNLKMYGPGVYVEIPPEVLAGQSQPGKGWGNSPPEEQNRRSIYIHVKRSLLTPILESFDLAETDRSTPLRFATTQPTQALGMLNGKFLGDQATATAS